MMDTPVMGLKMQLSFVVVSHKQLSQFNQKFSFDVHVQNLKLVVSHVTLQDQCTIII